MEVSELAFMIFKHDLNLLAQLNKHFNRLCSRVLRPSTELKTGRFHTKHGFYKVSDDAFSSKYPVYAVWVYKKLFHIHTKCDIRLICAYFKTAYRLICFDEYNQEGYLGSIFSPRRQLVKIGNLVFDRASYCSKKTDPFKMTISDELIILSCSGICFVSKNNGITSHLADAIKGYC